MRQMKAERIRRGWTQVELGARSTVSVAEISRIETGRLVPSPGQLKRLARALRLSPAHLLVEVPAPIGVLE